MPQKFISTLVSHFNSLAQKSICSDPLPPSSPKRLEVNERPLMVVVSADLRNHPVGRFWLPIARQVRSQFRLIHVAGHPHDSDSVRDQLRELSDDWWSLDPSEVFSVITRIRSESPSLLLDLGGHTADNHPAFLSHRLASVQATYLGFYGPSYGRCCDWWIVDHVLERFFASHIPVQKSFGPCLVRAFAMYRLCMVCLLSKVSTT